MRCIYTYVRTYNLYTYVSNLKYERPSPPGPSFYLLMQLFGSITVLDIWSPPPTPFILYPHPPCFSGSGQAQRLQGRALRLEQARGLSAAAREDKGAERCGQRWGQGYKNEGRGGGPEILHWVNPEKNTIFFVQDWRMSVSPGPTFGAPQTPVPVQERH